MNGKRVGHSTASVSCSASLYGKAQGKGLNRRGRKTLTTQMGLFGLGAPEIAVIAGVVALIYGRFLNSMIFLRECMNVDSFK